MNSNGPLGAMQRQIKGGKMMPAATEVSEDSILVKTIVEEHNPGEIEYDVRPIFHIVEDALRRSTLSSEGATTSARVRIDHDKDRSHHTGYANMSEALSAKIDRISRKISDNTLNGVDAHSTTVAIFDMLKIYKWDVKIVLALAGFTLTYGEFWLLAQIQDTNQLAKSMAILKQLPSIMKHASSLKPRFDTLNDLVNIIVEVTKCVIEFHDLPTQYITQDIPAYTTAYNYIPVASYWNVRSIVACTAQITSLTTLGYEIFTSTDASELSTLTLKIKNIIDHLRLLMHSCHEHIVLPIKQASLEQLRRKNVLLLFSGLEISTYVLLILEQIYNESKAYAPRMDSIYELVWIPIVDPNSEWVEPKQKLFESLQESMSWYSVYHPSLIGKSVIWFIQSKWKYKNKPILVVLDPQGRVSCPNAIHMMWIWGSAAYPFTISRAEALWKEETWRLELLVDGIDSEILNWIREGKYIFMYGGDDPEWVRRFVMEARRVATATKISLEMVYIGESNKGEQVRKIINTIIHKKLNTQCWSEESMTWFFWTRLQSMLFSKIQFKQTDDSDHMMQEIKKLLSYDKDGGWIVLARGSHIVVNGHATTGLQTLVEYDITWKEHAARDGFEAAFKNHYDKVHSVVSPGCRFEFSHAKERIAEPLLTCPECSGKMHVLTTFQCCHDEKINEDFFVSLDSPPTI